MSVLKKIKQRFCEHEFIKTTGYLIKGGKIKCELFGIYECTKCGKEEYELTPEFISKL